MIDQRKAFVKFLALAWRLAVVMAEVTVWLGAALLDVACLQLGGLTLESFSVERSTKQDLISLSIMASALAGMWAAVRTFWRAGWAEAKLAGAASLNWPKNTRPIKATPMAPPTCWTAFKVPEAEPACWASTPFKTAQNREPNTIPMPTPTTSRPGISCQEWTLSA
jgi:hypothetical protein